MAWEEDVEPDWFRELPFYLAAFAAHAALLTINPALRWGSAARAPEKLLPVEFVSLPAAALEPEPALAPSPGGDGAEETPRHGPGEYEPEKTKAGALEPAPEAPPLPKPAAVKKTLPKPAPKARALDPKAVIAASLAKRERLEKERALKAAAAAEASRRAEESRAAAERRAAQERERARLAAEARAARERRKAELSRQLAAMDDPELALDAGGGARAGAKAATGAGARPAGARKASAAAALESAGAPEPGGAAGEGGADPIGSPARGGGEGPASEGVSWSLEGPVGSRRVLRRAVPQSPDWVGTRGLDLSVTVRFQVLPDGSVKPGAVIQKTSGFPEIDRLALDSLQRWRFESVPSGKAADVWGRVTFRFTS